MWEARVERKHGVILVSRTEGESRTKRSKRKLFRAKTGKNDVAANILFEYLGVFHRV
jgi:hypothetical protein